MSRKPARGAYGSEGKFTPILKGVWALAALCGVQNAHISSISAQWNELDQKPRIAAIKSIMAGAKIDEHFVVDISIGSHWVKYWCDHHLSDEYGERKKWPHRYPDDHPQSKSNPQESWCYPLPALGHYRQWLQDEYIEGFPRPPSRLDSQGRQRPFSASIFRINKRDIHCD